MEYYSPMKNEIYSKVDDIGDHYIKRNRPQKDTYFFKFSIWKLKTKQNKNQSQP